MTNVVTIFEGFCGGLVKLGFLTSWH